MYAQVKRPHAHPSENSRVWDKNQIFTEEVTKSGSLLLLEKNSLLPKIGDQRCDRNCYL